MYLWISLKSDPIIGVVRKSINEGFCYPFASEGYNIIRQASRFYSAASPELSGVFADWLSDNRDALLTGATGPSDPAIRLDALIDYLRQRFNSVYGG